MKLEQQRKATGLRARVLDNEAFSRIRSAQPPQCDSFGGYVHVFPIWTDFGPIECSQTAKPHILRTGEAARRVFSTCDLCVAACETWVVKRAAECRAGQRAWRARVDVVDKSRVPHKRRGGSPCTSMYLDARSSAGVCATVWALPGLPSCAAACARRVGAAAASTRRVDRARQRD